MTGGERVSDLLDQLRVMIESARWIPIGADKCVIDRGAALDLLDEARSSFPQEIAEAERLVAARSDFIANAKREADTIRHNAEERSRQLVDEQEVLRIAKVESRDLLVSAETKAENLRRSVTEYVDDMLRSSVTTLSTALDELQNTRTRFTSAAGNAANAPRTSPRSQEYDAQEAPAAESAGYASEYNQDGNYEYSHDEEYGAEE